MSKILSDEDGDTIWNDPTPNIDDELDDLIEEAIHTGYVNGYNQMAQVANIAPYNHRQPYTEQQLSIALANKIKEAELREAKKIFSMLWDEDGAPFQRDDPPSEILRYIEKLEGSQDER